jgi:hypothetical protein
VYQHMNIDSRTNNNSSDKTSSNTTVINGWGEGGEKRHKEEHVTPPSNCFHASAVHTGTHKHISASLKRAKPDLVHHTHPGSQFQRQHMLTLQAGPSTDMVLRNSAPICSHKGAVRLACREQCNTVGKWVGGRENGATIPADDLWDLAL